MTGQFIITSKTTKKRLSENIFDNKDEATTWLSRIGPVLSENYTITSIHPNSHVRKILNEGLVRNDLEGILLPLLSVDEYVPADPESQNCVIAYFIKGVPEAVHPVMNFLSYCRGVLSVDSGDSDTMPNTSIIYTEFDRDKLNLKDIYIMVSDIGLLANLEPEEFSVSFPNFSKKYPFDINLLRKYFKQRSEKINKQAQQAAIQARVKELQQDLEKKLTPEQDEKPEEPDQQAEEKPEDKPEENSPTSSKEEPPEDNTKAEFENAIGESRLIESIVNLW